MAGSHRAPRSGGRAAAREARRQQSRRRNQIIGAGAAALLVLGGGGVAAVNAFGGGEAQESPKPGAAKGGEQKDQNLLADAKVLIDGTAAKPLTTTGAWAVAGTADGSSAPDKSFVCQAQRFADPAGVRTWVRTFRNASTKDTAVQYVEVSNDPSAAGKAYTTITGWLSQCNTPQIRLVASYATQGLGERGVIAVFGTPAGKSNKYRMVSVTTAGQATMVLEHDSAAGTPPKPDGVLATASAGLKRICAQTGADCGSGTLTAKPSLLPTGEPAGFMAPIDLPVLPSVDKPWVSVTSGLRAGTGCEKIDLKKSKPTKSKAQTYVVPEADVPTEFGLDTTVYQFASPATATSFVSLIRKNVDGCQKTTSNATVKTTGSVTLSTVKGEAWKASYDTGGGKIFTYRIGIAATGSRAIYVVYPVLKELDITDTAFTEILSRAAERSATFK
ncbi:hypothetical protein FB561_2981 [Kribbella amoyensis]|uniref:PknH-like protein n=1 Tax=Kribbella amoyensis TaxID=996641 RepID=A0A561BSI7_9ACTN|nr:hypothetical protein [Kribbella amoyensis]TWD81857.1 hypothetical protein FB561_2981 [Kribbella amoyensis]